MAEKKVDIATADQDPIIIRFLVSADDLKWKDAKVLQKGDLDASQALMARFLVDEDDQLVGQDRGIEILDELTLSQMTDVLRQFGEKLEVAIKDVIPSR